MLKTKGLISSFFEKKSGPPPVISITAASKLQLRQQRLRIVKQEACILLSVSFDNQTAGRPNQLTHNRRRLILAAVQIGDDEFTEDVVDRRNILQIMLSLNPSLVAKEHGGDLMLKYLTSTLE